MSCRPGARRRGWRDRRNPNSQTLGRSASSKPVALPLNALERRAMTFMRWPRPALQGAIPSAVDPGRRRIIPRVTFQKQGGTYPDCSIPTQTADWNIRPAVRRKRPPPMSGRRAPASPRPMPESVDLDVFNLPEREGNHQAVGILRPCARYPMLRQTAPIDSNMLIPSLRLNGEAKAEECSIAELPTCLVPETRRMGESSGTIFGSLKWRSVPATAMMFSR